MARSRTTSKAEPVMLNISDAPECATPALDRGTYKAFRIVGSSRAAHRFGRLVTGAVLMFLAGLFLPWT
jgi:hypothetical protein